MKKEKAQAAEIERLKEVVKRAEQKLAHAKDRLAAAKFRAKPVEPVKSTRHGSKSVTT